MSAQIAAALLSSPQVYALHRADLVGRKIDSHDLVILDAHHAPAVDVPDWLRNKTFVVEYSPNCHKKWMVRLCGHRKGEIDKLPPSESFDAIGYGETLAKAAENASSHYDRQRSNSVAKPRPFLDWPQ